MEENYEIRNRYSGIFKTKRMSFRNISSSGSEIDIVRSDAKKLGFVDEVPCQIEVCATEEQIQEIRDIALDFEFEAYDGPENYYPDEDDEAYQKFVRYGWLFDFL